LADRILRKALKLIKEEPVTRVTKPTTEEISAREEKTEEIKHFATIREEIRRKKPTFEEIFQEAVERLGEKLLRPMNATLKAEMEKALSETIPGQGMVTP
jgi:signal transduction protein with GAF and PtsI domain